MSHTAQMMTRVDLAAATRIATGGAAAVFRIGTRVFKVFLAPSDPASGTYGAPPASLAAVFESEVAAWEKSRGSEFLRQHTPGFHGTRVVAGLDPTKFLVNCSYEIDFIDGTDEKAGPLPWERPHLARAAEEFIRMGISFYEDASCFDINDPTTFKLIDFADRDVFAEPP
ncbi:MAG: hypothetical protein ACLP1X_23800 [Polyangiaceae bacterium]|jgi:hypothetical protein